MKTKKWFVLGALGASMLVSCNKEEIVPGQKDQEKETTNEEVKTYTIDELASIGIQTYSTPDEVRQFEMEHNGGINNPDRENVVLGGDTWGSAKLYDTHEDLLKIRPGYFRKAMENGTCQLFANPHYVPDYPFSEGDKADFYENLPSGLNKWSDDGNYTYQAIETNVWYDLEDHLTRTQYTYKRKADVSNIDTYTYYGWTESKVKLKADGKVEKIKDIDWYGIGSPGSTFPDPVIFGAGGPLPPPPASDDEHAWFEDFKIKSMKNKVSGIDLEMKRGMALVVRDTDTGNATYFSFPEYTDGELNPAWIFVKIKLTGETWDNTIDQVAFVKL